MHLIPFVVMAMSFDAAVAGAPPTAVSTVEERHATIEDQGGAAPRRADARPMADEHEIVVHARHRSTRADPLVAVNAKSFAIAQDVDDAVVGPVAMGYARTVPVPVQDGIRNFLNNTREPVVIISFLLEFKPGKAAETAGRLVINSVAGVGGLFDVAKRRPFNLPRRPNGFGDALGYHGVAAGPYLFLPLIGPTTVRDAIGGGVDRLVLPLAVGAPFNRLLYSLSTGTLNALGRRVRSDDDLQAAREADDPYARRREQFLRGRQAEIDGLHGISPARPDVPPPALPKSPAASGDVVLSVPTGQVPEGEDMAGDVEEQA
ncbi:MlaA family lipoprotein [Sphingomonas nostoxanthinifaciens]|uniref:MlaA family lipoprotein n=1 Tax=Sphingomonas nostoxanthinifaciens TaxID=2872652 RepID=UPI001CC20B57|nr:VacJ family lipoprotein [Sphingomonas nostoxanthinifaciens]UAK22857.1 VacJ family lipoprotein [Sphingomonas nostoxanthinifaciens]